MGSATAQMAEVAVRWCCNMKDWWEYANMSVNRCEECQAIPSEGLYEMVFVFGDFGICTNCQIDNTVGARISSNQPEVFYQIPN